MLSICIPARNEEWLGETIADIVKNREGETEIIVGLDGAWPVKEIPQYPNVNYVYFPESIGQRAITNQCVKLSRAKYIMKCDAHCSFDKGFDVKMIEAFKDTGDNVAMVPFMRNLHVYNWLCECGEETYQDKGDICPKCKKKMTKKMIWKPRKGTWNSSYCFDSEPHFQYFGAYKAKQVGDIVETMSLQGSCFMVARDKYWELKLCDEELGSWGSQGIEVACKMWLSGGRVLANKRTWYAHCFRTKAVFGFPYQLSGRQVQGAKAKVKDLFFNHKWDKQIHSLRWLVDKFNPPGWSEEDKKALV